MSTPFLLWSKWLLVFFARFEAGGFSFNRVAQTRAFNTREEGEDQEEEDERYF